MQVRFKRGYKSILKEHLADKSILELRTSIDEDANGLYRPPHFETYAARSAARVCIKDSRINYAFYGIPAVFNPSMNMRLLQVCFKQSQSRKIQVCFNHFRCFQNPQTSIFTGVSDLDFTGFAGTLAGFVALAFGLGELELCRA